MYKNNHNKVGKNQLAIALKIQIKIAIKKDLNQPTSYKDFKAISHANPPTRDAKKLGSKKFAAA